jgi:hypothetical protein
LSENGIRKEGERADDKKSFDHAPFDVDGGGSVRQKLGRKPRLFERRD